MQAEKYLAKHVHTWHLNAEKVIILCIAFDKISNLSLPNSFSICPIKYHCLSFFFKDFTESINSISICGRKNFWNSVVSYTFIQVFV